jgi:hypothetical protein
MIELPPNPALNRTGRHGFKLASVGAARRLACCVRRRKVHTAAMPLIIAGLD